MSTDVQAHVDVCGMCCPLPLIELTKAVASMQPGQVLEIIGNDPTFEVAVRDFCRAHGHTVLAATTWPDCKVCIRIEVRGG